MSEKSMSLKSTGLLYPEAFQDTPYKAVILAKTCKIANTSSLADSYNE